MLNNHLVHYILLFIFIQQFIFPICAFDCETNFYNNCYDKSADPSYYYVFSDIDKQSGTIEDNIKIPQVIISKNCINKLKAANGNQGIAIGRKFKIESKENNQITD